MSLLDLSDKIFLEIFDYLYLTEIIYSFHDIMCQHPRLHDLITNQLRSVNISKVDFRLMTKSQFLYACEQIKAQANYAERIQDLTLSNEYTFGQIRLFLSHISFDQLTNIRKLTLIQPALDEYHILFPTRLAQLTHLTLENPECDDDEKIILIDEMNDLVELTIKSDYTVQFRSQYNRVEKLFVSHVDIVDLIGLSTFFPNLNYLDITLFGNETELIEIQIPLLTVLKLRSYDVIHELCEKFLSNFPQLKQLYYSNEIDCTKQDYIDGSTCRKFLERLPLLELFEIDVYLYYTEYTNICELAASFQNEFYLSKNWNIVCESPPQTKDYHIYSVPLPEQTDFYITSDSLVSSAVLPIDDCYRNVQYLGLDMTLNWPVVTRFYPHINTLELTQTNHSQMIPTVSILSYLNKSMFLSNLEKLILPSPCHFDDTLLRYLLQQSALNIKNLDISCHYLLHLIKTNILQPPLPIHILTLRDDYLPNKDRQIFIEFFRSSLHCLTLFLQNHASLSETIEMFLDQFQHLFSLDVLVHDPISMLIHVQLCQMIQQRPHVGAELRPTNIRIWQK